MPSVMEDEYKHIKTTTDPARGMAWDHNVGTYKIQNQHDHNVYIIRMNLVSLVPSSLSQVNESTSHTRTFCDDDLWRADMIRYIRTTFGVPSQYENLVCCLSCD